MDVLPETFGFAELSLDQQVSYTRAYLAKKLPIHFTMEDYIGNKDCAPMKAALRRMLVARVDAIARLSDDDDDGQAGPSVRRRAFESLLNSSSVPGVEGVRLGFWVAEQYYSERDERIRIIESVLPDAAAAEVVKHL